MNIRVKLTKAENLAHYNSQIITLPLEEYLRGVVASEMYVGWHIQAYMCQAVAARTYAYYKMVTRQSYDYDVDDTARFQSYDISRIHESSDEATKKTRGMVLYYCGNVVKEAVYTASNGGKTISALERWGKDVPYLVVKYDPYDKKAGHKKHGHGVGMSQRGAQQAALQGLNYKQILAFYYPETEIRNINEGEKVDKNIYLHECILTHNRCYVDAVEVKPIGIMVHDTGVNNPWLCRYIAPDDGIIGKNKYNNHWNRYLKSNNKCVHAFIGKGIDGEVYTYQTLPWTLKAHHSGARKFSKLPSANSQGYIGFEIQRDNMKDEKYFNECYKQAVQLCVYLCRKYAIESNMIISHKEGHDLWIASNHGDPHKWFKKHGKTMDQFRQEVAERLGEKLSRTLYTKDRNKKEVEVKALQQALIAKGCLAEGSDDGWFGKVTETAVMKFQEKTGLPVTGIADERTQDLLYGDVVEEPSESPIIDLKENLLAQIDKLKGMVESL